MNTSEIVTEDRIDLMSLIDTLRRQASLIGITMAAVLGIAVIYLLAVTPTYTATALVEVDPAPRGLLEQDTGSALNPSFANARVESEVELLRSDAVALRVVRDQNLVQDPEFGVDLGLIGKLKAVLGLGGAPAENPQQKLRDLIERFHKATTIRRKGQTFLISVAVTSRDPNRAAELANALSNAYIAHQVEAKIESSLAARDTLKRQAEALRQELVKAEQALDDFIARNIDRIQKETGRTDIAELNALLASIRENRLQNEMRLSTAENSLASRNWQALAQTLQDDVLNELSRQQQSIRARLGTLSQDAPERQDLQQQIAELDARLEQESRKTIEGLRSGLGDLSQKEQETRRKLRETLLGGQLPPDLLTRLFEIQQDAANARSQYQTLLTRLRDIETQAGLQIAHSRLVSQALPPTRPSFPRKGLILGLAAAIGLVLGIFFAILREFFIGGFTSDEQLQEALGAASGTSTPLVVQLAKGEISPADKIVNAPLSAYSEATRRLRAVIDQNHDAIRAQSPQSDPTPVILVTSSLPNEGKTTTALALARAYSQAGKSVVLLDADLRKPRLHLFVGEEPSSGFLEYLFDEQGEKVTMKHFLSKDPLTGATLALGRTRSAIPTDQLVLSERFVSVINAARDTFDVVILDSPPMLPVIDATYLARYADIVVVLARWASTGQQELRSTTRMLRDAIRPGARIISVLSHKEEKQPRGYAAHYGYGDE